MKKRLRARSLFYVPPPCTIRSIVLRSWQKNFLKERGMIVEKSLSLESPEVLEAQKRFESRRKKKLRLSFIELFERFGASHESLESIGKGAARDGGNISREAIRQLYERYFAELFPERPRHQALHTLHALHRLREEREKHLTEGVLGEVARRAQKAGYRVDTLRTENSWKKRTILVNNKVCRVLQIKSVCKPCPGAIMLYFHSNIPVANLSKFDFYIVVTSMFGFPTRFFVVSSKTLAQTGGKALKHIYVPFKQRPVYNNHYGKIRWWDHEDAWHLLEE